MTMRRGVLLLLWFLVILQGYKALGKRNPKPFKFSVKACNDAHVALVLPSGRLYELVIGGWKNSRVCIRKRKQGRCVKFKRGRFLHCRRFRLFAVSWQRGRIVIRRKNRVILWYNTGNRHLQVKSIKISTGWGARGVWKFPDGRTVLTPNRYQYRTVKGKCGRNAFIFGRKCRCKRGFVGNPYRKCRPTGKCGRNAVRFGKRCRCRRGFRGNPYKICRRKCGRNAFRSGRRCRCKRGFVGNPYRKCRPTGKCGRNAVRFGKRCRCRRGFRGNPYKICRRKCGRNAFRSGRRCRCKRGFVGNPYWKCRPRVCKGETARVICRAFRRQRRACPVPGAEYVTFVTPPPRRFCSFGLTYGFHGDDIWVSGKCSGSFVVCFKPETKPKPNDCITPSDPQGRKYEGNVATTVSGYRCQRWSSQYPHKHRFSEALKREKNYCRNPDGELGPWCYTTNSKKRWELCEIPKCVPKEIGCISISDPKGKDYKGEQAVTKSGYTCQYWSAQSPHKHRFAKLGDQKNYCRNPDGEHGPWCYTTNKNKRWEQCEIPICKPPPPPNPTSRDGCIHESDPKGLKYKGRKSVTVSGRTCQAWSRQSPHHHKFKNLAPDYNFCRNPDNEAGPWCYTTDPKKRWELCRISRCAPCEVEEIPGRNCKIIYKVSGKCDFRSHYRNKCKYDVTTKKDKYGRTIASVIYRQRLYTLRNGKTLRKCATFTMRGNMLIIQDKICAKRCPKPKE